MVRLFEVKLMLPATQEPAPDMPEKWERQLGGVADIVEGRLDTAVPDEGSFQAKLAIPATTQWPGFPADYRTKRGRTVTHVINTFAKNIGKSFKEWKNRLKRVFTQEGKLFKDAVKDSKERVGKELQEKLLRVTGDRVHGIGAGTIATFWLTGEPTVAGKLRPGDELIAGGPFRICRVETIQAFRAALMNRLVQSALLISNTNYQPTIITEQNTINNDLVQSFIDPALGLKPFAPDGDSNVDFLLEEGVFKLRLKASTV